MIHNCPTCNIGWECGETNPGYCHLRKECICPDCFRSKK